MLIATANDLDKLSVNDNLIHIAIFSAKRFNLFDVLIKIFTRSKYTHAAIYLPETKSFIEPYGHGFLGLHAYWCINPISKHKHETLYIYELKTTSEQKKDFLKFANFIVQEKLLYNYLGVIGFVLPFFTSNGGFFCSEGVFNALKFADILKTTEQGWKINPDLLVSYLQVANAELVATIEL